MAGSRMMLLSSAGLDRTQGRDPVTAATCATLIGHTGWVTAPHPPRRHYRLIVAGCHDATDLGLAHSHVLRVIADR